MPKIIATKLQEVLFSGFRGEDFWKSFTDDDDGRKVMPIAHMAFGQVS